VVVGLDGNLSTMRSDGTDRVALTTDAGPGVQFTQPTWSPDGRRIAWIEIRNIGVGAAATLVTSTVDGSTRTEAPLDVGAFYLYWDPSSSKVAYLGSSGQRLELGLVDVAAGGDTATPLRSGQPFYFSWAPDGRQMLIHVGAHQLGKLALDGSVASIGEPPGRFPAPAWSADGASLVFASGSGRSQHLVVTDPSGENERELVTFDGGIRFVLSRDSTHLAYQVTGGGRNDPADRGLWVLDLATGKVQRVSPEPALAFFWSPDGDRLLFLGVETAGGTTWGRWHVWDGRRSFPMARFRPSETLARNYLQFFDQYAQSLSFWAPDGSAFAYAGTGGSGATGIWVQPARHDSQPVRVADGVFVAWSPH
jgi:Tol biopolymer transport system component